MVIGRRVAYPLSRNHSVESIDYSKKVGFSVARDYPGGQSLATETTTENPAQLVDFTKWFLESACATLPQRGIAIPILPKENGSSR